jgi:hypothetical protein
MANKLFMILLGCKPKGRHTEQHDIFFTIEKSIKDIIPHIESFWKDGGKIHIDAWREVTEVDGNAITVVKKTTAENIVTSKIFFLNLGGYKPGEFEEYHYKMLAVAEKKSDAIKQAKATAFYKHTGFKGAASHIDDKYGIDVDDIYEITDILPTEIKAAYQIKITPSKKASKDEWHLGYLNLKKLSEK